MTGFTDLPIEIQLDIYRHLAPGHGAGHTYMALAKRVGTDPPTDFKVYESTDSRAEELNCTLADSSFHLLGSVVQTGSLYLDSRL